MSDDKIEGTYVLRLEYICGGKATLRCADDPAAIKALKEKASFFVTRKCPACQAEEGDITPDETEILVDQAMHDLAEAIFGFIVPPKRNVKSARDTFIAQPNTDSSKLN